MLLLVGYIYFQALCLCSGILAMPLMYSLMGWLLATLVLIGTAILGVFTTTLMVHVGIAEHTESFHMTIQKTMGKVTVVAPANS